MKSMRRYLGILALLAISTVFNPVAYGASICLEVFASNEVLHERALSQVDSRIHDLSAFRLSINVGKALGEDSAALIALEAKYRKDENALVKYIDETQIITRLEFVTKMRQEIMTMQMNFNARDKSGSGNFND